MSARVSFVRSGLAGLGRFVFLTSAICIGMIIAISGPPTPSETASLGSAVSHVVRRFDSAALHFTFDLCDNVPVAAHAAGLCAKPTVAVARALPAGREIEVSAVSETLPASAREILPPDTIDQIARPTQHRSELLGEGRPAPRLAHAHAPRPLARAASAARARSLRASSHRSTRAAAHARRQAAHARAVRARPHPVAPPVRRVRATPIAAPQASAIEQRPPPAHAAPASAPTHVAENVPPPEPAPRAPEEHANVAPEEHAPPPPEQSDEDKQPNNPETDDPAAAEDIKL